MHLDHVVLPRSRWSARMRGQVACGMVWLEPPVEEGAPARRAWHGGLALDVW